MTTWSEVTGTTLTWPDFSGNWFVIGWFWPPGWFADTTTSWSTVTGGATTWTEV